MAAVTRWVQYDISETGVAGTGGTGGRGTRGSSFGDSMTEDLFDIGTANNRLWLKIDGYPVPATGYGITLASGTELDPRFVAKDISEKMHNSGQGAGWDQAQCVWDDNQFKIYSGSLGVTSSVLVISGTNTAHLDLGWGSVGGGGGVATANINDQNYITVSGTYNGFFDEMYKIVISNDVSIGTPSKGGPNTYAGTITTGGVFDYNTTLTYTLEISVLNGTTMGAGVGKVPQLSWTETTHVDDGGPIDLLYADYWYNLGTKGAMVKFSDAVFNTTTDAWDIVCTGVTLANGGAAAPIGTAKFVWGSTRGDDSDLAYTTTTGTWSQLGTRGLYVNFNAPTLANLTAGDEFYVIATPPQPASYDITNLNYGNVTVSTESPVKAVMFEIMSGAVEISTVKFGVQANGNFEHHGEGTGDTYFRFGTVGPGNKSGTSPIDGIEWRTSVTAANITGTTPPSFLYAIDGDLQVVADADSSEALGVSTYAGMVADPVWLNIKLGTAEVGANSTINYRIYFDYS